MWGSRVYYMWVVQRDYTTDTREIWPGGIHTRNTKHGSPGARYNLLGVIVRAYRICIKCGNTKRVWSWIETKPLRCKKCAHLLAEKLRCERCSKEWWLEGRRLAIWKYRRTKMPMRTLCKECVPFRFQFKTKGGG